MALVIYGMAGLGERGQAYDLLARAAAAHWGFSSLPQIVRAEGGKPHFAGLEGHAFNLSHSGTLALCALDDAPVGVDIQVVKQWRPTLPGRVCSAEELEWLGTGEALWPRFTQLWALKESRVKCDGSGLRGKLSAIPVPLPRLGEAPYFLDGLWFRTYVGQGWRGAVCGLTPPPEEIVWVERPARDLAAQLGEKP